MSFIITYVHGYFACHISHIIIYNCPDSSPRSCLVGDGFPARQRGEGVAPRQAPWINDDARKSMKMASIQDFFKPPPKPGHPSTSALPAKKRGRPPSTPAVTTGNDADLPGSSATPTSDAVPPPNSASSTFDSSPALGKRAAASLLGVKLQRTSWGNNPEKLERLRKAVADWD
jgi:hypothetical protein